MHAYEDHAKSYQIFNINPEKSTSLEEGLKEMALWVKQVGIRKTPKFQNIEITDKLPAVWMED